MPAGAPSLGTQAFSTLGDRCTILLHIDVPAKVGRQVMRLLTSDSDAI